MEHFERQKDYPLINASLDAACSFARVLTSSPNSFILNKNFAPKLLGVYNCAL